MEQAKKNLKIWSILVLVWAACGLVKSVVTLILAKFDPATAPTDMTEGLFNILKIVTFVITVALVLPRIYVGITGLKAANAPVNGKAHITWAYILVGLMAIAMISPISDLIKGQEILDNVVALATTLLEISIYLQYVNFAKLVKNQI